MTTPGSFEEALDGLREWAARRIWSSYLPSEAVAIHFTDLATVRGAVCWIGDRWLVTLDRGNREWRKTLLHEVYHVLGGHQTRSRPPAGTVRGGRLDETEMARNPAAVVTVSRHEQEADDFARRELRRWA